MPPLNLLIKPVSSNCNLRCSYCFYNSVSENRHVKSYGAMEPEILEILVRKALEYADGFCTFAFQGGEPTLAGTGFFENLITFQKKHNNKKIKITNAVQTNGTLINREWAKFLAENRFLVGVSLDGPKHIHDINRCDAYGNGSYPKVMDCIGVFNKYMVQYNILCVVNSYVARHTAMVYNFFKRNNFKYLQFIPCLDSIGGRLGSGKYSLLPESFTYFLKTLFDLWYNDAVKGDMTSIRYFDNLMEILSGHPPELCGMSGQCACYFAIEADGSTFPCDFYMSDEWYLGNIVETGFNELAGSCAALKFVEESKYIDPKCRSCKWFKLCRGGCRRNREPFKNGIPDLNLYCESYDEFFKYSVARICRIAEMLTEGRI